MSQSDFWKVGNCQCNTQQWGYLHSFRIYDGTHLPGELPMAAAIPDPLVSLDVVDGEIVFGGTASYDGVVQGNPTIVRGPRGRDDAIVFNIELDE